MPDLDLSLSGFDEDEVKDLLRSLEARERREWVEQFDLEAALEEATRAPRSKPGELWLAQEARRLGGLRRGRERTLAVAYDLAGLGSIEAIRRIVEIALFDVLGLENSIARARVLISGALAGAKLLESGELEERIAALEAAGSGAAAPAAGGFDDEP